MALARLDAAVRYFDPAVAARQSSWDSLFAANALRIIDAPTSGDYAKAIDALMVQLHSVSQRTGAPQRALVYDGFPPPGGLQSGGYGIKWRDAGSGETSRVEMGENAFVAVPISEPSADTIGGAGVLMPPNSAQWRAVYPSTGYRILAAARIWSTIRLFYPYKNLIGENWDDQLRAAFPQVEAARDSLEYGQAIARFASHIHDAHVVVGSAALQRYIGQVHIGAAARLIDNQLVITRIVDTSASRAGLRLGDVVLSIDGEPTAARIARLTPYYSAGTPQALQWRLESALMNGRDEGPSRLVVRNASGERTVDVPRSNRFAARFSKQRDGSIIRLLPGNVGYVDLDRLTTPMVDSAFRVLARTKAIVFDMRGYPNSTAWVIAPRLNTHADPTVGAKFKRLVVPSPDTSRTTLYEFDQPIPSAGLAPKYTGKTVMLYDERSISQAEHTGLFFEAANGTEFIGSPSMGANGDVTSLLIPGSISISFTGHDVRHADGRQLQRVGQLPKLAVLPTIAGIRAGRDEVLEAAVKYVGGTGEIPVDTVKDVAPAIIALPGEPTVAGWSGNDLVGGEYRVGLDRTVAHSGTSSGHITARSAAPDGFGMLAQSLRAEAYRGKRVRFSAYVKTRDVTGSAGIWMRVDGNGGALAFDNMGTRPVRGTTDWHQVSIVLDVPSEADGFALGMLMTGPGQAWIDDASLEVVGSEVAITNMMPPSTNAANVERYKRMYATMPVAPMNPGFEPQA
jgi:C-terminal processing protease CtpA/Prc